jgi:exodeoxyribonuclease III
LKQADPDILCLNETKCDIAKITKMKFNEAIPEGYEQHWNCSEVKKGYSGVALLTKVKPVGVYYGINIAKHDGEGRVLTAEYDSFYLVLTYVPNAGEGLKRVDYRTKEWDVDF